MNCRHYDKNSYNECHEPNAERVLEKEKGNFCDYFSPGSAGHDRAASAKADTLTKLNELFKK